MSEEAKPKIHDIAPAAPQDPDSAVEASKKTVEIPTAEVDANLQKSMLKPSEKSQSVTDVLNTHHEAQESQEQVGSRSSKGNMSFIIVACVVAVTLIVLGVLGIMSTSSGDADETTGPASTSIVETTPSPVVVETSTPEEDLTEIAETLQQIDEIADLTTDDISDEALGF